MAAIAQTLGIDLKRPQGHILFEKELIHATRALHSVIRDRFTTDPSSITGTCLRIHHLVDYKNRRGHWIVGSNDPDYLFGFRIAADAERISLDHALNLWSMWAEDYVREALAERLDSLIMEESGKKRNPNVASVSNMEAWLKTCGKNATEIQKFLNERLAKMPDQFKTIAAH